MTFKKYVWSWTAVGALIPILLAIVSVFLPKPQEFNPFEERKPTPSQQTRVVATMVLYPALLVEEVLSLTVTDAGGDSGARLAGAIIFGISVVLNAFVYALAGVVTRIIGTRLRAFVKGAST